MPKYTQQVQQAIDDIMTRASEIEAPPPATGYSSLTRLFENPDNRVVVSFGGGSVHGLSGNCALAHLLTQLDLWKNVDEIWGTSAGAVVGGCIASGQTAHGVLKATESLAHKRAVDVSRWEVFVKGLVRLALFKRLPEGLVRGAVFRSTIQECLMKDNFEQCEKPMHVIACSDDGHARKFVFDSGPLLPAIMASMCIPGIVFPTDDKGKGTGYFDGGVVEKTPLISIIEKHRRSQSSKELIVLCTHFDNEARIAPPRGFLQRFVSSLHAMEDVIWRNQLDQAKREDGVRVITVNPRMELGGMFDFELTRFNYLWALNRFREQLSNARLGLRFGAR